MGNTSAISWNKGARTISGSRVWKTSVRWSDCDPAGILYHAKAFDWFSEARVAWLHGCGLDYYHVLRARGYELLVLEAQASFRVALRPGEPVSVVISVEHLSPTRMGFRYQAVREDQPEHGAEALFGRTQHAFVFQGRAVRLDRHWPEAYQRLLHAAATPGKDLG
ncbi:MAG: acyl-CoA thioesterase [Firmicutes bacterium]|nr:acyl-CoA thioesterase [Bacillota bacterium]